MPLLSTPEALHVSDSFLSSLYGDDIFRRWKELKDEMKFLTEREYVSWLIDVANQFKDGDDFMEGDSACEEQMDKEDILESDYVDAAVTSVEVESEYSEVDAKLCDELSMLEGGTFDPMTQPQYGNTHSVADGKRRRLSGEEEGVSGCEVKCEDTGVGTGGDEGTLQIDSAQHDSDYQSSGVAVTDYYTSGVAEASTVDNKQQRHPPAAATGSKRQGGFSCLYCQYTGVKKFSLDTHLIARHGFKSNFMCDNCGKYFPTPSKMRNHSSHCRSSDVA